LAKTHPVVKAPNWPWNVACVVKSDDRACPLGTAAASPGAYLQRQSWLKPQCAEVWLRSSRGKVAIKRSNV